MKELKESPSEETVKESPPSPSKETQPTKIIPDDNLKKTIEEKKLSMFIGETFEVALTKEGLPKIQSKASNYTLLSELLQEKIKANESLLFKREDIPKILEIKFEALKAANDESLGIFEYLCGVYVTLDEKANLVSQSLVENIRAMVVEKFYNLLFNDTNNNVNDEFLMDFLNMLERHPSIYTRKILEGVTSILLKTEEGKENLSFIYTILYKVLVERLGKIKVQDDTNELLLRINATYTLLQDKAFKELFMNFELDLERESGRSKELGTFLGHLLRYSYLQDKCTYASQYFSSSRIHTLDIISSAQKNKLALIMSLDRVQEPIFEFITLLYDGDKKEDMIKWFRQVANLNADRMKMMHGGNISSTGFVFNVFHALLHLLNRYIEDPEAYLKQASRIDLKYCEQGYLNYKKYNTKPLHEESKEEPNEMTELFFLAHYYMDLCFSEMTKVINTMLREYKRNKNEIFFYIVCTYEIYTTSPSFLQLLANFLAFTACALLFKIKPANNSLNEYIESFESIDVLDSLFSHLQNLPEQIIKNLIEAFDYYYSIMNLNLFSYNEFLIPFQVKLYLMLLASNYKKNYYFCGSLMGFFGKLIKDRKLIVPKNLTVHIVQDKFFFNHVMEVAIKSFVSVEKTGTHNQFFEKFEYRYNTLEVIRFVWDVKGSEELWKAACKKDLTLILLFANYFLNDFTYFYNHLSESLKESNRLQILLSQNEISNTMTEEAKEDAKKKLKQEVRMVRSLAPHVNLMLDVMSDLTRATPELFTSEELIELFANTLNFNLRLLVLDEENIVVLFVL